MILKISESMLILLLILVGHEGWGCKLAGIFVVSTKLRDKLWMKQKHGIMFVSKETIRQV
jgi:hypothetical protein